MNRCLNVAGLSVATTLCLSLVVQPKTLNASETITGVILAQNPPAASTYNPGPWQPVARINPQQSVNLTLVNQSSVTLEYGLTTTGTANLANGQSISYNNLPLDSYVVINPLVASLSLQYNLEVVNNNITLTVRPSGDQAGLRTVNIQSTGGIFIY
ncbi:MAG: hypothetical protein KFF72_13180 [Arthrospira sp. SH-MAG29]|nr:hypothetical protein [Arthrospira sp. SH-MAG29]MBS0017281.1 hypothetical protein [Arthrospira sp. SH-MAG29]